METEFNRPFSLQQNYPNPFNPATNISYSITRPQIIQLEVYDLVGRKVASLVSEYQDAGSYSFRFDASSLSSGVYSTV